MSVSAVAAITPDPTANNLDSSSKPSARRRIVAVEKKSNTEMVAGGGINGVVGDRVVENGKDLSRTIRGDYSEVKKGLVNSSTISPRRRKHAPKPEKPKWVRILSIFAKNCLLFALLFWLGQMIWYWTERIGDNSNYPLVASDYEGRISEVEASFKKTAKMLQVQLEVVDKKIGNQFGIVTKDLRQIEEKSALLEKELKKVGARTDYEGRISEVEASFKKTAKMLQVQLEVVDKKIGNQFGIVTKDLRQIEEKSALLEKELKKVGARTDYLDKSLRELKDMGLLSKEEFESFWNELKGSASLELGDEHEHLDHIRAHLRDVVEKEIERHAADGLGRVDYALASAGARVVRHSEPYVFGKANNWFSVAKNRNGVHANAQKMLEPSFGEPGQCFPLEGSAGFVEIRLRTGIIPEAITLEHVSKRVAYDRSSAPKDCQVSAWFESPGEVPSRRAEKLFLLAEFSYDLEKTNVQTFNVEAADVSVVNMVRFDFTSNHGSSALTCIYRLRVHGHEPNTAAAIDMEA